MESSDNHPMVGLNHPILNFGAGAMYIVKATHPDALKARLEKSIYRVDRSESPGIEECNGAAA